MCANPEIAANALNQKMTPDLQAEIAILLSTICGLAAKKNTYGTFNGLLKTLFT